MAKRASAHMTAGEQAAGTALFVIYLLVLPFAASPMFRFLEGPERREGSRIHKLMYTRFFATLPLDITF